MRKPEPTGSGDGGAAAIDEELEDLSYEPPLKASSQLPFDVTVREQRRPREQAVAVAMERVLRKLGIEASPWLERLAVEWPVVAGAAAAAKCRPGKFHNGILYVYVRNSVDLFNIRRTDLPAMERAVRAFAGDVPVRQVRLMIG
jgi:hypothetical protein